MDVPPILARRGLAARIESRHADAAHVSMSARDAGWSFTTAVCSIALSMTRCCIIRALLSLSKSLSKMVSNRFGSNQVALTKVNAAEVVSSDGYRIKYGRDTLTYTEGARYLIIPIEHLGDPYEMRIYLHAAGGWQVKGTDAGALLAPDMSKVRSRLEESLNLLGGKFSFDDANQ